MRLKKPIIIDVLEEDGFIPKLGESISSKLSDDSKYLLSYPTVYIHEWKRDADNPKGLYDIYVGESNDVIERTKEHYVDSRDTKKWQSHLVRDGVTPRLYIIGHEHFNKSLSLDVENRLIDYVLGMNNVSNVYNSRGNPQNEYYGSDELDLIFSKIWKELRKRNKDLFLSESEIKDSAIYKASPLHKLAPEQIEAKKKIINKIYEAVSTEKENQLVFVQGEAGTGKTVLMSSLFLDLLENTNGVFDKPLKCCLLVNHDEQITVYNEIARKLNLFESYGEDIVSKPTHFINSEKPIDAAIIDEGHLLLTQGKQAYRGKNQLEDIMKLSKVTVFVFDENQILTAEQYWESELINKKLKLSKEQDNYIRLDYQFRMQCNLTTLRFIDGITIHQRIGLLKKDPNYEIKVFKTPELLYKAICKKAENKSTRLSRLLATYDWDYKDTPQEDNKLWGVEIGDFFLPWNRELTKNLGRREKLVNKKLAWAEQKQTIKEVGSTFTIQGFDLNYAGVIIGPSVTYRNGKIVFDGSKSKNAKAVQNRTLSDNTKKEFSEELLRHELRVLLTRGINGLYIYACDKALNDRLMYVVNHQTTAEFIPLEKKDLLN